MIKSMVYKKIKAIIDYFKQSKKAKILLFSLLIILLVIIILIIIGARDASEEYSRLPEKEKMARQKSENKVIQRMAKYLKRGTDKVLTDFLLKKTKEIPISPVPTTKNGGKETGPPPFNTKPFEKGYKLSNIIITLEDFEKKFNLYYPNNSVARSNLENWQYIASLLTEEAILQNEAIKVGILSTSDNGLNPKKLNLARDYFKKEGTTYINSEVISLWFYNTNPPAMGVETAKKKTQQIIESLRNRIISKEINMKQAGQIIASMTDLEAIDFAYKSNAYLSLNFVKPTDKIFNDSDLNSALWKLNEQGLSPILIGKDFSSTKGWYEAYFVIIKVNSKNIKEFSNIEELIQKRIKDGLKINI